MTTEYGTQAGSEAGASGGKIPLSVVMQQMAEQNSRLMKLLEQFTGNQATSTQQNAPDKTLESLATNLKQFHFDPENGLTFDRWFSKYEDLFRQDGRSLDDTAKVKLLLRSLSVPVHEKFLNYLLPSHPRDFTFDEVVDEMKQIFGQHKSLFSKRYDCLNIEKNEADDFVTYAGTVNRQCEDVELQKLTVDQFKSLVFIAVSSHRRTPTSGPDFCRSSSPIKLKPSTWQDWSPKTDIFNGPGSSAVKEASEQPDEVISRHQDTSITMLAMRRNAFVKDCKFSKHTCKQCGKVGHKDGYCGCFSKSSTTESKAGSKKKKPFNTKVIQIVKQVRSRRRFISVNFNGKSVELQLDCGSDITVISTHTWKMICSPSSTVTSVEASTASGEPLELVGEFTCPVTIGKTTKASVCYITSVEYLNVIGLDCLDAFDLRSKPLAANCNQVEEELYRLERLDIISPVDFSDWAAPIIVVKKPGGKVRVCADYSTGLNAALETNNHPLPTPEEIFSKVSGSQVFSIIDLSDAFLQVEVDDESKKL
ncbi:uncharacterized protein K02A2.6-like [Toxorhynchites rutilus septentrionalis]|uniref:uncharacterized protein K02A2.6-like n=1 Tax=Toxorhynchites rutilus septentrionalis TaxID=329112 RepID=UPI0024793080|nr:uncharacterized protein K02A2.6-like [Toxorhynchites rutilus septentrionalis]